MSTQPILRRPLLAATSITLAQPAVARGRFLTLASTTSTEQTGLFRHLLPIFRQASGIAVRVVALGSGQALDLARRGDADVVLTHDPAAEERFLAEGFGGPRRLVMSNDFLLAGPAADPAGIAGLDDAAAALRAIAALSARFISRGDRSGTHAAERRLWALAGVDPLSGRGGWYREIGQGMGAALNAAAAQGAHVLADRASWLAFRNRQGLRILVEGDARLFNPYAVLPVSAERHPHVKAAEALRFVEWILSPEGQGAIAGFQIGGEQPFRPKAREGGAPAARLPAGDKRCGLG